MDSVFSPQQSPVAPILSSFWDHIPAYVVTSIAIFIYIIHKHSKSTLQRFFYLPPNNFRETFANGIKAKGKIGKLAIGVKTGSMRRRIVLGSRKPLSVSTLPLNTNEDTDNSESKYFSLRIPQVDVGMPETFLRNVKPIEPNDLERKIIYGFFHPNSFANGGGERVLWEAIKATLDKDENNIVCLYTFASDKKMSASSLLDSVLVNFNVDVNYNLDRLVLVHLNDKLKWGLDGSNWKFASLIMQCFSSIRVALHAINQLPPDVFIDTQGFPFVYWVISFFIGIPVVSYIHYPVISRDMLATIQTTSLYGYLKYTYWFIMLKMFQFNLKFANVKMCNSTWTMNHINPDYEQTNIRNDHIKQKDVINIIPTVEVQNKEFFDIVYPPCSSNKSELDNMGVDQVLKISRKRQMVYLAQFRPEKRHTLLLTHYANYATKCSQPYKLVFIGSTRTDGDLKFVEKLKQHALNLKIDPKLIHWELNASNETVEEYLTQSEVGLNCMWKEHFGISVVEYCLHGMLPLCHASAGPLEDIVLPWDESTSTISTKEQMLPEERSGLLFRDETDPDYGAFPAKYPTLLEAMLSISEMNQKDKHRMRSNALNVARHKFGRGVFEAQWNSQLEKTTEIELALRELRDKVERVY